MLTKKLQEEPWQAGDIAACWGAAPSSRMISLGTSSVFGPAGLRFAPSHVAIACEHEGRVLWVESAAGISRPCLIRREIVSGVQAHIPEERILDYILAGGRVMRFRLSSLDRLQLVESVLLSNMLINYFIRKKITYDAQNAPLAGTRVFRLTRLFPGADLHSVFCSELVSAVLMRLGRMPRDNPTKYSPGRMLRQLVRCGTYFADRRWAFHRRD